MKSAALGLVLAFILLTACQTEAPPPRSELKPVTAVSARLPTATIASTPEASISILPTCPPHEIEILTAALPPYTPSTGERVRVHKNQLVLGEVTFILRGINYYPIEYPFWKLLQVDLTTLVWDFELMAQTGINTVRISVWMEALFTCPGSGAVPLPAQFERLDTIVQTAARYNLRIILVLYDRTHPSSLLPYDQRETLTTQITYLAARYREEPALLAWDIRNAGDVDYQGGSVGGIEFEAITERVVVLDWLARLAAAVRIAAPQQLVTAGWNQDAAATAPSVDFVSFQFWGEYEELIEAFAPLRQQTDKPIVLIGVGYESQTDNESLQASRLQRTLTLAEQLIAAGDLSGWSVWTAFDFTPGSACDVISCPQENDKRHFFGLWRSDRSPKPAANVIELFTRPPILPTATPTSTN